MVLLGRAIMGLFWVTIGICSLIGLIIFSPLLLWEKGKQLMQRKYL